MHVAKPAVVIQQNAPPTGDLQSTPMVLNAKQARIGLDMFSPIIPIPEHAQNLFENEKDEASSCIDGASSVYSLKDVSSWVGGKKKKGVARIAHCVSFC